MRISLSSKEETHSPSRENVDPCTLSCIHLHFERIRPRCHGNTKRFKGDRWISSERSKWRVKETSARREGETFRGARKGDQSSSFAVEIAIQREKLSPTFSSANLHTLPHPLTLHPFIAFSIFLHHHPCRASSHPAASPATLARAARLRRRRER